MTCLEQSVAFMYNDFVESKLTKESTVSYENFFNGVTFDQLKSIAKSHINMPEVLPKDNKIFWFKKGSIHLNEKIIEISNRYIKPLLGNPDAFLIGDTAFCINHPPHDLHVDSRDFRTNPQEKQNIIGYKTVVIPLEIDTDDYPFLFTMEQYFYGPSTRFRKGHEQYDVSPEIENQKNGGVYFSYNYKNDGVKNLSKKLLTKQWYNCYIDYDIKKPWGVPFSAFEGFSIEKNNVWKPNNVIIFDSARVHCGELISKRGATYKLGISLNYGLKI